jgi:hypothetical protein
MPDFKRCQASQCLATMFLDMFAEVLTGFEALLMGLGRGFTQQSKFMLWEQTSSYVCHKSNTARIQVGRVPIFKEEPQFFFAAPVVHVSASCLTQFWRDDGTQEGQDTSTQGKVFSWSSSACHARSLKVQTHRDDFRFLTRRPDKLGAIQVAVFSSRVCCQLHEQRSRSN